MKIKDATHYRNDDAIAPKKIKRHFNKYKYVTGILPNGEEATVCVHDEWEEYRYYCGGCGKWLEAELAQNYCGVCGRKIDWSVIQNE